MSHGTLDFVLDRPLPQTPEAERAVLGAILISNDAYFRLGNKIQPDDFFKDANRRIFAAMQQLGDGGLEIDYFTLRNQLGDEYGTCGGSTYLSALTEPIPDVTAIERYADIVCSKAALRRLLSLASGVMRESLDSGADPVEIAQRAALALIPTTGVRDERARPLVEVLKEAVAERQTLCAADKSPCLTTGYRSLDEYGCIRSTLIVIAAPSEAGKSTFMVNLADQLAERGQPNVMFSLEADVNDLSLQHLSMSAGIKHNRVRDFRYLTAADYPRLAPAMKRVSQTPIFVTRGLRSIEDLYTESLRLKMTHGIMAAFVDYIQLVDVRERIRDREERLATIGDRLLAMAIDLKIAVVALSQVNEDFKKRDSGRLEMADIAYAKAIGKSARAILMFQRPGLLNPKSEVPKCEAFFQLEKNSNGRKGDFVMHFDAAMQKFTEGHCVDNTCSSRSDREQTPDLFVTA